MDELTAYIIKNYIHLMTILERAAYKNLDVKDYRVKELLKNGAEPFLQSVCERILREHREELIINRCPKCEALARTPFAKQCPKCFFDWHETTSSGKAKSEDIEGIQR
jgi:hypothetical protein